MRNSGIALVLYLLGVPWAAFGAGGTAPASPSLAGAVEGRRVAAARAALTARQAAVSGLEAVVTDYFARYPGTHYSGPGGDLNMRFQEATSTTEAAIRLLGMLRAVDAAPLLASHLRWHNPIVAWGRFPSVEDLLPCQAALDDIGPSAVVPLLDAVSKTDDIEFSRTVAGLMVGFLGAKAAASFATDKLEALKGGDERRRMGVLVAEIPTSRPMEILMGPDRTPKP